MTSNELAIYKSGIRKGIILLKKGMKELNLGTYDKQVHKLKFENNYNKFPRTEDGVRLKTAVFMTLCEIHNKKDKVTNRQIIKIVDVMFTKR